MAIQTVVDHGGRFCGASFLRAFPLFFGFPVLLLMSYSSLLRRLATLVCSVIPGIGRMATAVRLAFVGRAVQRKALRGDHTVEVCRGRLEKLPRVLDLCVYF